MATKSFILSEESINDRGFRVLTNGINLERFKKNPVMLWMHQRDHGYSMATALPIGIWENIRKEDGKLMADPKFDEKDGFAMMIKSKVEDDLIRGCSAGINPVEFSSDPKDLEKGQTRSTITKCEIYEASIVDMPSNKNTVRLFSSGDEINEVPLIKNTMADKKDGKQFTFKSEEDFLAFAKQKFGLEPKVETPEEKKEEGFNFKSEDDARNWFQKLFGIEPKAKEPEKEKEDLKTTPKVEETEDSEEKKEIAQLKAQIETLKGGPGAEDLKSNEATDDAPSGGMEELLSDGDIALFNSIKQ